MICLSKMSNLPFLKMTFRYIITGRIIEFQILSCSLNIRP